MKISTEELVKGLISGNRRILGKAITLIESKNTQMREQAEELLKKIMPLTGNSTRVGISGIPGVGKSTFIESFGKHLIQKGKKVAVLAIDPSSSLNKGSILGDKTRMEELAKEENAFIRPSPSSGFLGGVANTTFETLLICEAAGFDYILIETVGVGQSETMVCDITDVFLFIKIIGDGDELQGIKRGIMEMVDIVFINKVNEENLSKAKLTKQELLRALHFMHEKEKNWKVPVHLGSALDNNGISEVYNSIKSFIELKKKNNNFSEIRKLQAKKRFEYWVQYYIIEALNNSNHTMEDHENTVTELLSNPSSEAKIFVEKMLGKKIN